MKCVDCKRTIELLTEGSDGKWRCYKCEAKQFEKERNELLTKSGIV